MKTTTITKTITEEVNIITPKDFVDWLNKQTIFKNFATNLLLYNPTGNIFVECKDTPNSLILGAFNWHETEERFTFWLTYSVEWIKFCDKNKIVKIELY